MIIFGMTSRNKTVESGTFYCPICQGEQVYDHKAVRRWFTLYFIPCIPMGHLGEYIECRTCKGNLALNVLDYNPSEGPADPENMDALFLVACKQAMIGMLLADGQPSDREVHALQNSFELLAGVEVTEDDLREEIEHIARNGSHALEIAGQAAPQLNDASKEALMKQAYQMARADGPMSKAESRFFEQLGHALVISRAHLRGILLDLDEEPTSGH